jgi:hypothetical protein
MNLLRTYGWLCIATGLLGACYREAPDQFISAGTNVSPGKETNDRNADQNRWTYKQMKSAYLWEEFLPDTAALSFDGAPKPFFEKLRYGGDRFSYIELNPDFETYSLYDRYGLDYASYQTAGGELVHRALLVRSETQAAKKGLKRGDWFQVTEHTETAVGLLKGSVQGGNFRPQQRLDLQAQTQEEGYAAAVLLDSVYRVDDRRVAYLFYAEFMDVSGVLNNPYRAELKTAFAKFKQQGATDLIVDLRYNRGGYVSICQYLASLILPDEFLGEVSGYHSYNKRLAAEQYAKTGNAEEVLFFAGANIIGGSNLGLGKTYFIITGQSASASESLINSLSPLIGVVKIGETSTGKGVGSWTIQSREYQWQLQPITFRYYNREHQTVPDSGLTPDLFADETQAGVLYELGDSRELLLRTALNEIGGRELRSESTGEKIELIPAGGPTSRRRRTEGYIHIF